MYKKEFKLSPEKIKALKEVINEKNSIWIESGYYGGKRFGFKVTKEWAKNNPLFMKYDSLSRVNLESYVKMITEFNRIKKDFLEKNCSEPIAYELLIRNSCFRFYIQDEIDEVVFDEDTFGYLMLDHKYPLGNYDYIRDVLYQLGIDTHEDEYDEKWAEEKFEEVVKLIYSYLVNEDFDENLHIRNRRGAYWYMEIVPPKKSLFENVKSWFN